MVFFFFFFLTTFPCFLANGHCHAVQARLCHKCCGHIISLGPYLLIYDVIALCPSGYVRLLFFSFLLCALDKRTFCHSLPFPLDPAPHFPLDNNDSIAWSMCAPVLYINPMPSPGKLQSSLLGYFPGLYETATGDPDVPSRHS